MTTGSSFSLLQPIADATRAREINERVRRDEVDINLVYLFFKRAARRVEEVNVGFGFPFPALAVRNARQLQPMLLPQLRHL